MRTECSRSYKQIRTSCDIGKFFSIVQSLEQVQEQIEKTKFAASSGLRTAFKRWLGHSKLDSKEQALYSVYTC